jgi:hypothetical protein
LCLEHVVPVVVGWPETLDGRMQSDHGASHILAGAIGVKATVNRIAVVEESG